MEARVDQFNRDETYRFYVTESIRLSPQGKWLAKSYIDVVSGFKKEPEKTGEEIVNSVMQNAGLKFMEKNE